MRSQRPRPLPATTTPRCPRRPESSGRNHHPHRTGQKRLPLPRFQLPRLAGADFAFCLRFSSATAATVTAMFGGLNRLLAAALVAGAASAAVLAGPPAALACNSGVSAVNVYKECAQ